MKKRQTYSMYPRMTCGAVMKKAFARRGFKFKNGAFRRVRNNILILFTPHDYKTRTGACLYEAYTLEKNEEKGRPPHVNVSDKLCNVKHIDGWIKFSQVKLK